jgi:hypothetical protein
VSRSHLLVTRYRRHLEVAMLGIGFVVCGVASVLLGQDNNWDLRNYHYYNPYAFLGDRLGFDFAPAQRQTYLNPIPDLPFYLGATHLPPRLFGFLMGGIQGFGFGLLFAICLTVFRGLAPGARLGMSALCAALGIYAPVFAGELGASQNDTLVGLFVLGSIALAVRVLADHGTLAPHESRTRLVAASVLLGIGTGLKPTLMLHVPALVVALCLAEATWRRRATVLAVGSVAFLAGFLAANGYWMVRLWQEFGNPFFPFYNDIFQSPWAEPRSYADRSMIPATLGEALARPFAFAYESRYAVLQSGFRDARYAVLTALLAAALLAWLVRLAMKRQARGRLPFRGLSVEARFLLVFFVISFVAWEAAFSIIRYASSLEALAPLLIVVVSRDLVARRALRAAIVLAAFAWTAVAMRPIQHPRLEWGGTFWDAQVPEIEDPEHAMVILANSRPWGYLVPMFPSQVRCISLNNNLTHPMRSTLMQTEIRRIIKSHTGDFYLLSTSPRSDWLQYDREVLAYYNLAVVEDSARPITSKHSLPGMHVWTLRRY